MITMHIVSYLAIIIVNTLQFVQYDSSRVCEITTICYLAVISICTVIFGLIVNKIVNKIQAITSYSESIASSLMTAAAGSD
jgi:hypothetical protein